MISDSVLERFCRIVSVHTGLVIPSHDMSHLREKLIRRLHATRLGGAERYLALLASEGTAGEVEWRELVLELTTGESYFFRDSGQMRLLREVVLPELLRNREAERSLRVWSAGCSTGEEPYSLAILLQELLGGAGPWNLMIKGTDINEYALQQAREGRYGRWAFRGVGEEVLNRHFSPVRGEWQLSAALRGMVTFERVNLIKDLFPDSGRGLCDLDLIVCRNVFIYFDNNAIAGIMARFAACLRPGGYVLTGHAEVQQPVAQLVASGVLPLVARQFPDSVIFYRPVEGDPVVMTRQQRMHALAGPVRPRVVVAPLPKRVGGQQGGGGATAGHVAPVRVAVQRSAAVPVEQSVEQGVKEVRSLLAQGRYGESIRLADRLLAAGAAHLVADLTLLLARGHASLGDGLKAEGYCRDALRHRPFAAEPHFLLATLVHDRGDLEQAKVLLQKTLYVDRAHVPAYLQLAMLYQEEGNLERARQMRLGALDVLHGLPAAHRVEHYEEWTVQELVVQLEKLLGEKEG
ncbi:MAG: hypothetical protein HQL90_09610 [Magnetococcales bacterium]|nr:hypothetical protein [Magnetococcales bacterium]